MFRHFLIKEHIWVLSHARHHQIHYIHTIFIHRILSHALSLSKHPNPKHSNQTHTLFPKSKTIIFFPNYRKRVSLHGICQFDIMDPRITKQNTQKCSVVLKEKEKNRFLPCSLISFLESVSMELQQSVNIETNINCEEVMI